MTLSVFEVVESYRPCFFTLGIAIVHFDLSCQEEQLMDTNQGWQFQLVSMDFCSRTGAESDRFVDLLSGF